VVAFVDRLTDFDEGKAFMAPEVIMPITIAPINAIICFPRDEIFEFVVDRYSAFLVYAIKK
jgi:hypothetical protein